jgi:hypothetical protein
MASHSHIQSRFDTYLCRAEEARKIAATLRTAEDRQLWNEIADEWQRLAEQLVGGPRDTGR